MLSKQCFFNWNLHIGTIYGLRFPVIVYVNKKYIIQFTIVSITNNKLKSNNLLMCYFIATIKHTKTIMLTLRHEDNLDLQKREIYLLFIYYYYGHLTNKLKLAHYYSTTKTKYRAFREVGDFFHQHIHLPMAGQGALADLDLTAVMYLDLTAVASQRLAEVHMGGSLVSGTRFPYEKKKERKKSMCDFNLIIIAANINMGKTLETKNITHCWKGIKEDVQQTQ
ncbi:hypothetical protein ACJX0J_011627 [Zea mays]